jgi:hypothetical protein
VEEEDGAALVAADDPHEHEVGEHEEERVDDEPQLPEDRVVVLFAQVRPRQLDGELAAPPRGPKVRPERRQADSVRLVDVPLRELVLAGAARALCFSDGAHRRRRFSAWLLCNGVRLTAAYGAARA